MSIYEKMRIRHTQEIYDMLYSCRHLTIKVAAEKLGMCPRNLRRIAYNYSVSFKGSHGGKTSCRKDTPGELSYKNKILNTEVTLPTVPWE
jgi:hypothetical protein